MPQTTPVNHLGSFPPCTHCAADTHSVLMAPVESLSVPDTMPGAGGTTNPIIDLDLEGELGVSEPAPECDKWEILVEIQLGKSVHAKGSGKAMKR